MNRLKELRMQKKETQDDIAKVANVSSMTVSRWENGESQIKQDKAQALADYLGVSVGYLLGYDLNYSEKKIEKEVQTEFKEVYSSLQPYLETYAKTTDVITRSLDNIIQGIQKDFISEEEVITSLEQIKEILSTQEYALKLMIEHTTLKTRIEVFKNSKV